jgi:hypothetical protein
VYFNAAGSGSVRKNSNLYLQQYFDNSESFLFVCLARKRCGGWDIVVEWVPSPVEVDSKRSRLERGLLQIDPFSAFSVAASQLAESGRFFIGEAYYFPNFRKWS